MYEAKKTRHKADSREIYTCNAKQFYRTKKQKIIQHFLCCSRKRADMCCSTWKPPQWVNLCQAEPKMCILKKIWVKLALTVVLLSPKKTECYFGWLLIVASASFDVRISYEMMGLVSELELHSRLRFPLLDSLHTAHIWINYDSIVRPAEKT